MKRYILFLTLLLSSLLLMSSNVYAQSKQTAVSYDRVSVKQSDGLKIANVIVKPMTATSFTVGREVISKNESTLVVIPINVFEFEWDTTAINTVEKTILKYCIYATTIDTIYSITYGAVNDTIILYYGTDNSATGTAIDTIGTTTNGTMNKISSGITNAAVPAGNQIWAKFKNAATVPNKHYLRSVGHYTSP